MMKATRSRAAARKDTKEAVKPVEERTGKRKAAIKVDNSSKKRTKNVKSAKKDPNKPKRPPTAFFVFLEEFRKVYKQEHPKVKAVSAVGKAGGEKWKSLSAAVMHKSSNVAPTGPGYAPITCSANLELLWHGQANASLEKAPYEAKAAKRKSEYEKLMAAYNKKQASSDDEEEAESETSKSQVNDKDEEESEEEEEDEDDDDDDD
ncbi:hypothetical protein COLO4_25700 [Corchorus olitorius]|uniref:HMG box domain-containing protein n=1 Tax=Corchorus olitorius TaxID=93759 RepID=A0A1R3I0D8_9ROSI|nr:hypothetical protein COLO4_25700 [Corchorus olitorius]